MAFKDSTKFILAVLNEKSHVAYGENICIEI
jgi:hypothetical protein